MKGSQDERTKGKHENNLSINIKITYIHILFNSEILLVGINRKVLAHTHEKILYLTGC